MEVKCRLCGNPTNDKDGICTICRMFRKDEVEALRKRDGKINNTEGQFDESAAVGRSNEANLAGDVPESTPSTGPRVISRSKNKTHGGARPGGSAEGRMKMAVKDYDSHRKCSTEGCFKYAVKEGMCTRCYNKAHGIEKNTGRKPGEKKIYPSQSCEVDGCGKYKYKDRRCMVHWKEKHGMLTVRKAVIPQKPVVAIKNKKSNGDYDGIMLKLINVKTEYQQKLTEIDSAIEVLKKYAA